MEHIMKLNEQAFERIKQGKKKREYRTNDDKRKQVRIGDTIIFQKLPDLVETIKVKVINIHKYDTLEDAVSEHFEEDFSERHDSINETVNSFYKNGYYTEEEVRKNGIVVFEIKKPRLLHYNSTACYLKKNDKILMIKFNKKWGQVYAPPGGKFEEGESPLDCITREFYEETGLNLVNPRLQGISFWHDSVDGIIFVYTAEDFNGELKLTSEEGTLEWVKFEDLTLINQFDQNKFFTSYLFKSEVFEAKFILDESHKIKECTIK
ncbi:MAG: NUDIX domain-containing protein [Bacilli bacterium]|nr:NUDIX domain-containing protein [Bacilli bacterium]